MPDSPLILTQMLTLHYFLHLLISIIPQFPILNQIESSCLDNGNPFPLGIKVFLG